ncbi:unnamed protein product [Albugo candida]|uniref:Vacuolar protein 8 n=1 Tax=Albugo candida TaxID=65357 RepID=A0A024G7B4_9STRA|nr:unnamed protein product [Albugo candida]|eukprot:CCI42216.1 unnamed protein product [Albugo candida]
MSKLLEQLVARGRRERNSPEQREIAYNLAEISTNPQYHEKMVLKGAIQALTHLLTNTNDVEALQLTCMCLANIASCPVTRTRIVKDGVLPLLINHLKSSETDITSKQYLAMMLGNLAFESALHKDIIKEDAINALVSLMNAENTILGAFCAFALTNISLNEDYRCDIVEEGGISRLIDLACSSDVKAQIQALTCLGGLCIDPQYRSRAVEEGIIDVLILMARVELSHVRTQVAAALCSLSSAVESQVEIADRALLTIISLSLSGDPKVEEHACGAIANLTEREDIHEKILSENGLMILMTLGRAKELDTRAEACRCFANLTTNVNILQAIARKEIVEILIEDVSVDHFICQRYAALAIANICMDEHHQSVVVSLGAIRPLIRLARAFDREIEARRYSILAFANLAAREANHSILLDEDCLQALYALSSTADGTCQYFVAYALANLASNSETHTKMVEEGGLQPIIALASSQDTDVHHHATAALRGLAVQEAVRIKIIQEGGMEPLVLLLQSDDPQVLREVCAAIYNLSLSEEALFEIPNSGAIPYLLHCCQSSDLEIVQQSCAIIANVAEKHENQILVCQHEGIPPLAANMRSHDIIVQREAGRAIANLTALEGSHDAIVANKAHKLLIMYLESPDGPCKRVGVMGICNLTRNELFRQKLMNGNTLSLLMAHTQSNVTEIVQFSLLAIANFALSPQIHAKMVEKGVLICVASNTNASNDQIRSFATYVIARIARNPSYRTLITESGGLTPLLRLIERKEECVDHEILPAICSLSFLDANKQNISLHAIPFLVGMLSDCHSDALRWTCCTIANMAERLDLQPHLVTANVIPRLCHILQNKDERLQAEAARAIGNVAIHYEYAILILQHEILPNLRLMLSGKDVTCQRMSVMTLHNLSSATENHIKVFGCMTESHSDTLSVLLSTLKEGLSSHSMQDHEVIEHCLLTISNLSASTITHREIMESALDLLIAYTKQGDIKCRHYAIFALGNLCFNTENVDRLVQAHVVKIMITYMFPGELQVQIQAVAAIRALCVSETVRLQTVSEGVLEPLNLSVCSNSTDLKREAAAAFVTLTHSEEIKVKMTKEGCVTLLLSLMTCNDPETQVFAMTAIANIAEMTQDSTHDSMIQEGLLTALGASTEPYLTRQRNRCFALLSMNLRLHSALMKMNALGGVVASTSVNVENALECYRFTSILIANLSINAAFHRQLIEQGGVEALSIALQLLRDTERLEAERVNAQREIAAALRNLSCSQFALSKDTLTLLRKLMEEEDYETLENACIAVRDLATYPLALTPFRSVKGVESLLNLLKRFTCIQVKRTACQALYNLSLHSEIQSEIVHFEGLPILLALLQFEDASLSHSTCSVLANIAENHANRSKMAQHGVFQHLKFALRVANETQRMEMAISVQQEAIRTIANMAVDDTVAAKLVSTGALYVLREALESQDAQTQRCAALALANLSANEQTIPKLIQNDVFPLCLSLHKRCDRIDETTYHLLTLFTNVASSNSIPIEKAIEMLTIFIHSLQQFDWDVRRMGAFGIANFAAQTELHSLLLSFSGKDAATGSDVALIPLLMDLIECEDVSCQRHILSSIRGLCCDEKARKALYDVGVIPILFRLLKSTSGDTQTQVFASLINLSSSGFIDRHVDLMIKLLGIDRLISFLCTPEIVCRLFGAISIKSVTAAQQKRYHESIFTAGAIQALIETHYDTNDDTCRCIALALCDLCCIASEYRQTVVAQGGIPCILKLALVEEESDRSAAIATIRQLSQVAAYRECIASIGLHPICRAISDIPTSSEMAENAIITLYEYSHETKYQQRIADAVAYGDLWRIAASNVPLAEVACGIVANISELFTIHSHLQSQQEFKLFFDFDAFIVRPCTPNALVESLCILKNLAAHSENHSTMLSRNQQRLLYWALETSFDVDVRLQALLGLANFACNPLALERLLFDFDSDFCRMQLLLSLFDEENPIFIQRVVAVIIGNVAALLGFQELLLKAGASTALIDVLKREKDMPLRHCVTNVCVKLAQHSEHLRQFGNVIQSPEIFIDLIWEAQRDNADTELRNTVLLDAMRMLRSLSELKECSVEMMRLHAHKVIDVLISTSCSRDSKLQSETVLCCYHLTKSTVNQKLLADGKVLQVILPLCVSPNEHIACCACATVANISQCEETHAILRDSNVIPLVVRAIKEKRLPVLREAIRLVANSITTNEFQTSFIAKDVVKVSLETSLNGDDACQLQASLALYRVSSSGTQRLLLTEFAIETLHTLLLSTNERVQSHAIGTLGNLSLEHGAFLVANHTISAIICMLQRRPLSCCDDMTIAVLRSLALESEFSNVFHENGGLLPLWKRCCESTDRRLLRQCAGLLLHFADDTQRFVLTHWKQYEDAMEALLRNAIAFDDIQIARNVGQNLCIRTFKPENHITLPLYRCLIELMSLHDEHCGSYAALAIGNIAASRKDQAFILQCGGIQSLVTLLDSQSSSCQEHAARAIARLAAYEENQERLFKAEAHTQLIQLLDTKSSSIRLHVVMAICNLTAHDPKNTESIVQAHAISLLIQTLETGDSMCNKAVCRALCNLSTAVVEKLHLFIEKEDIRSIVRVAIRPTRKTCLLLSNFAMNLNVATALVDANALVPVIRLLSSSCVKDQRTGALAMYNMSRDRQKEATIADKVLDSNLIRLVTSLDPWVSLYAIMTLGNVSSSSHVRQLCEENGIGSALIAIIKENKKEKARDTTLRIGDAACITLCNLAYSSHTQKEIFHREALEVILRLKGRQRLKWMILSNVAADKRNQRILWEEGVVQRAVDATDSIDKDIRLYSTLLIANISGNTNYNDILGEIGGVKCLLALTCSQDPNLQTLAISSLCCLCQYSPSNRLLFIQANGLSSLLMAANATTIETHRHVAAFFLILSLKDAFPNQLARPDIISTLLQLANSAEEHVAFYSCGALANISERVENHHAFTGIQKLITRLLQHESALVVREALWMTWNLLSNISYQNELIANGFCDLFLVGLRSNSECQYVTALALEKLTRNVTSYSTFFSGNGVVTLLHLAHSSDEQTQLKSISALRNLVCSEAHAVAFDTSKHLGTVVALLEHANPMIQRATAEIVHRLSFRSEWRKEISEKGVLILVKRCVIDVIKRRAEAIDWDFAYECVGVVANYAEDAFYQTEMMDTDLVGALIHLVKALYEEKSDSWALADWIEQDVARTLAILCGNELFQKDIYEKGVLQCLLMLAESFDEKTRGFASLGIRLLASNVKVCKHIASGSLSPFLQLAGSANVDLKQTASFVLANLTVSEENKVILGGHIDRMIELCHCTDVRVRRYGVFALANMSSVLHLESDALCESGITTLLMLSGDEELSIRRDVARAFVHLSRHKSLYAKLIPRGNSILFPLSKASDLDTKRFATLAICNFASRISKHERAHLATDRDIQSLIHLARFHDVDVQRHVVLALAGFLMEAQDKLFMIEKGLVGPLIDLLRSPHPHVQLCGSLALNLVVLGIDDGLKVAVMEQNAFPPLGALVHSAHVECVKSALYCIGTLCENRIVLKAFDEHDLTSTITDLARHSDTEIQRSCGYMLALWAEHDYEFQEATINASISLAEVQDRECQDYASFILAHLSSNRQYQPLLLRGGALGPLIAMVTKEPYPKHYAGLALLQLADNYENHLQIVEKGGVEALLRLARIRSPDKEIQYKASKSLGQLAKNATEALAIK